MIEEGLHFRSPVEMEINHTVCYFARWTGSLIRANLIRPTKVLLGLVRFDPLRERTMVKTRLTSGVCFELGGARLRIKVDQLALLI